MTESITNPKLLKVEIYFDGNDCLGKCKFVLFSDARLLNLLNIMGQILSKSLLRVAVGAEIEVSSVFVLYSILYS